MPGWQSNLDSQLSFEFLLPVFFLEMVSMLSAVPGVEAGP